MLEQNVVTEMELCQNLYLSCPFVHMPTLALRDCQTVTGTLEQSAVTEMELCQNLYPNCPFVPRGISVWQMIRVFAILSHEWETSE